MPESSSSSQGFYLKRRTVSVMMMQPLTHSTELHVYFKLQVLFYTLRKALGQSLDIFGFPHPDLLSPEITVLQTYFLLQRFSQNSLSVQFSSVHFLSCVRLFATPWITARQASLSITNSRSSLRLTSMESVMPSSHLILCHPLLLRPPIPPSIRVFSNESTLRMYGSLV